MRRRTERQTQTHRRPRPLYISPRLRLTRNVISIAVRGSSAAEAGPKQLTVDVQMNGLDERSQARHGRDALQAGLIVVGADRQRARPPLRPVVDRAQTAQARHGRRVREPEVVGDVTSADVDVEARRRVAAERDAAQRPRLVFHGAQNVR